MAGFPTHKKLYFAHPKSDFGGTDRQLTALSAIKDAFFLNDVDIINPDEDGHQRGYADYGMDYFGDIIRSKCNSLAFLRFPNGGIGAGVAREVATALAHGLAVFEVFEGRIYPTLSMPGPILSVEDTRATLRSLAA
jgi:hypothetical protein